MVTSAKQVVANRRNAQKSTGPRTANGKHIASKNALVHGILSGDLMVGTEDPTQFQALLNGLVTDFQPVGTNEIMLTEKMAIALWKMKRLNAVEAATIKSAQSITNAKHAIAPPGSLGSLHNALTLNAFPNNTDRLIRYQSQLEGQYYRALAMLQSVQDRRRTFTDPATLP
jgi:hypothetical protein